ncbi:MAG: prepilin-type N-terminal cleavage/methylation domain-containing protein [Planctomycetota bacterium]|nr:prepilin-type N-terminal cleavage/methylation domain-containing protein [Planctomycetota bacterium]MDG2144317.1 prepilin-type N-terminal cleavage/methylation domain-containing protein [Planctomycetota bacterium]
MHKPSNKRGFTLIELILAMGLFSLLMIALLQLIDTSTTLWRNVDARREKTESSGGMGERLAKDLSTLEAGQEGDFLADWGLIEADGDKVPTLTAARMRFVRRASSAELSRLAESQEVEFTPEEIAELALLEEAGILESLKDWSRMNRGLVEVTWFLCADDVPIVQGEIPRFHGKLMRGMRTVDDGSSMSFFDERIFMTSGRPIFEAAGVIEEIATGVLWMNMEFASQATLTDSDFSKDAAPRAWKAGELVTDGSLSWDAWSQNRPNVEACDRNKPAAGLTPMDALDTNPQLPRRVRITFEMQPERDILRRTTLRAAIDHQVDQFIVADGMRLPEAGTHILVDEEWMLMTSKSGDRVNVKRAQRGTMAGAHRPGTMVQYGWSTTREIPIAMFREDWDL